MNTEHEGEVVSTIEPKVVALDWRTLDLSGKNLIEASAGTGKTFTLVLFVLRLLLERELSLSAILLSTYTEAATSELRERIAARITQAHRASLPVNDPAYCAIALDDPLSDYLTQRWVPVRSKQNVRLRDQQLLARALTEVSDMPVRTLHSFCRHVLVSFELGNLDPDAKIEDANLLTEAAIDDAIRRRFADVNNLGEVLRDALDSHFLQTLRRCIQRVLTQGRVRMRAPERVDAAKYRVARAGLYQQSSIEGLRQILQDSAQVVLLRESHKRALQTIIRCLQRPSENSLPKAAMLEFASGKAQLQKAKTDLATHSPAGFALVAFAKLAERAWRGEFAQLVNELSIEVRQLRAAHLAARGALSFDAMIEELANKLDPLAGSATDRIAGKSLAAAIHQRYPAALIDEFQDTDAQQWAILNAIYGVRGGLLLVGDPKQSIYRFRGSDVHTFTRAKVSCKRHHLLHNYRASAELVSALNSFYRACDRPFFSTDVRFQDALVGRIDAATSLAPNVDGKSGLYLIEVKRSETSKQSDLRICLESACAALSARYFSRINHADTPPRLAMLLARNKDVFEAQRVLAGYGIQAAARASLSVYQSDAARLLSALLLALRDPTKLALVRAARVRLGIDPLLANESMVDRVLLAWASGLHNCWLRQGVSAVCLRMCAEVSLERSAPCVSSPDAFQFEVDAKHLAETLGQFEQELLMGSSSYASDFSLRAQAVILHLAQAMQDDARASDPNLRQRVTQLSSVQLMTVHAAKGLEFDEVFLPTLWWSRAPDQDLAVLPGELGLECDAGSAEFDHAIELESDEALGELLRLQYVAMTRAKTASHVFFCAEVVGKTKHRNALQWHFESADATPAELTWEQQMTSSSVADPLWRLGLQALCAQPNIHWQQCAQVPELASTTENLLGDDSVRLARVAVEVIDMPLLSTSRSARKRLSFSALTEQRSGDEQGIRAQDADLAVEESALPIGPMTLLPLFVETEPDEDADGDAEGDDGAGTPEILALAAYRGPGFGQALHALFEDAFLESLSIEQVRRRTAEHAISPPLIENEALQKVLEMVARTRESVLMPGFALAQLSAQRCLVELAFQIPMRQLSLPKLAELGPQFGLPALFLPPNGREFRIKQVDGMLVGFIDLVFEHAGRFYLLDYKSNYLGGKLSDYAQAALAEAMDVHHYHLQHLLYALALHRYLKAGLPGYDFDQHFGGAHYLFVRAFGLSRMRDAPVSDALAPGHYCYRAPKAMIERLDAMFAGP